MVLVHSVELTELGLNTSVVNQHLNHLNHIIHLNLKARESGEYITVAGTPDAGHLWRAVQLFRAIDLLLKKHCVNIENVEFLLLH